MRDGRHTRARLGAVARRKVLPQGGGHLLRLPAAGAHHGALGRAYQFRGGSQGRVRLGGHADADVAKDAADQPAAARRRGHRRALHLRRRTGGARQGSRRHQGQVRRAAWNPAGARQRRDRQRQVRLRLGWRGRSLYVPHRQPHLQEGAEAARRQRGADGDRLGAPRRGGAEVCADRLQVPRAAGLRPHRDVCGNVHRPRERQHHGAGRATADVRVHQAARLGGGRLHERRQGQQGDRHAPRRDPHRRAGRVRRLPRRPERAGPGRGGEEPRRVRDDRRPALLLHRRRRPVHARGQPDDHRSQEGPGQAAAGRVRRPLQG
mmetsp:Transcript_15476/g.50391  ORF Transcript_15476/g.50391 Transcript_15476/m.50391 type:complete len:320 (-) Transcript_15476:1074-2033(-)